MNTPVYANSRVAAASLLLGGGHYYRTINALCHINIHIYAHY